MDAYGGLRSIEVDIHCLYFWERDVTFGKVIHCRYGS